MHFIYSITMNIFIMLAHAHVYATCVVDGIVFAVAD